MRIACAVLALTVLGAVVGGCATGVKSGAPESEGVVHHVSQADLAGVAATEGVKADEVTLWVNGLGCPLCATNIDKQLETLSTVTSVKVDLGTGKVKVGMLPGKPHPSPAEFSRVVENAGFTLVKVE